MKKKKKGLSRHNRLIRLALFAVMGASLLGFFIAFHIGVFEVDEVNPPYFETLQPSDSEYPFVVENNIIEFRNRTDSYCNPYISGQILGIDGIPLMQTISNDLNLHLVRHEEAGDLSGLGFINPDMDSDHILFHSLVANGFYSVWLKSVSTGNQLSPTIHFSFSGCQSGVAQFNFVQVAEIP